MTHRCVWVGSSCIIDVMFKFKFTLAQALPYILLVCGALGTIASTMLTLDKIDLLENPAFKPLCNINPLLSCVSVASSPQGHVLFDIPNMLFGTPAFASIMAVGVTLLAGVQLKRWFWRLLNAGLLVAMIFVFWLIWQSIYVIGALCLYCMLVWVVTAMMFWYTTLYNLQQDNLPGASRHKRLTSFLLANHDVILVSWYALIALMILQHFWTYFSLLI